MRIIFFALFTLLAATAVRAQYAPQAGLFGSTAISKTSPLFVGWTTNCGVQRGLQQAGNPGLGYASLGSAGSALGTPDGMALSLGDSGVALLQFASPITDGPGADFAVFENGFLYAGDSENAFLELAFAEVSSDGEHFTRFPATSLTQDTQQLSPSTPPSLVNARHINNLAGKYIAGWGTPFDLSELADSPHLDIHAITHVRIVDVVGSTGTYASFDHEGRKINDPFPSPFPGGGFDLDAVGVIHQLPLNVSGAAKAALRCFPNPARERVQIMLPFGNAWLRLYDASGRLLQEKFSEEKTAQLSLRALAPGAYFIVAQNPDGTSCRVQLSHF
jgi:hypothetical protein